MPLCDALEKEVGHASVFYAPATMYGTEGLDGYFHNVTYVTNCASIARNRSFIGDSVVCGNLLDIDYPPGSIVVLPRMFDNWNGDKEPDYFRRALHTVYTLMSHGAKAVLFLGAGEDAARVGFPPEKLWGLKRDLRDGMEICEMHQNGSMHLLVYEI